MSICRARYLTIACIAIAAPGCQSGKPEAEPLALWKGFRSGAQAVYSIRYSDKSISDMRPFFGGSGQAPAPGMVHSFRTSVSGKLAIYAESENELRFWIVDPKVEVFVDGSLSEESTEKLFQAASQGAWATYGETGALSSAGTFSKERGAEDPLAHGMWTSLLTRMQWSIPRNDSGESWSSTEVAPNGYVGFEYLRQSAATGRISLSKRAQAGNAQPRYEDDPVQPKVEETTSIELDIVTGLLAKLTSNQKTQLLAGTETVGASESSLVIEPLELTSDLKKSLERLQYDDAAYKLTTLPIFLSGPEADDYLRRPMEERRLAGKTADQVWVAFDRSFDKSTSVALSAYLSLKALLYLQPHQCLEARSRLITAKYGSPAFQAVSGALADVGSREAQSALRDCFERRLSDKRAAMEIAAAMGAIKFPEDSTIRLLQQSVESTSDSELSASCMLALGRQANSLSKRERKRLDPLMEWLVQRSASAKDEEARRISYLALGNTGHTTALPVLLVGAEDTKPALRAAAAFAMRWIESQPARSKLAEVSMNDPEPDVRKNAIAALGYQRDSEALLAPALNDKSESVRIAALEALSKQTELSDATLRKVKELHNDPDKSVREMAAALLAR